MILRAGDEEGAPEAWNVPDAADVAATHAFVDYALAVASKRGAGGD